MVANRRIAASNYLDYREDRAFLEQYASFRAPTEIGSSDGGSVASPTAPTRPQGVFEVLQAKFGFQPSSVANQKENFACWVANAQLRLQERGSGDAYSAVWYVHRRFFKNYIKWCRFLGTKPFLALEGAPMLVLEKEIALFLCVWGESANLRFMPECICFLYHSMASKLVDVETLRDLPEGDFLRRIVRPVYNVISTMRTAGSHVDANNRPVDHQDITNYDDMNEFFWTPDCLDFDELNIAHALKVHDPKTFREKRSFFNPLLAFFRLWFFLLVVFHILVVIVYVGYYTRTEGSGGWNYYDNWFDSTMSDVRNQAVLSVFLSITGLLGFKVILEVWLFGSRLFKDGWLAVGLYCRFMWHSFFFAVFWLVNLAPSEPVVFGLGGTYLELGYLIAAVYCVPVGIASFVRMFCPNVLWAIRILNTLDGTQRQYIGREMRQPWKWFFLYGASWSVIYLLKFLFTLELMVKPLVGPSIEIYNTALSSEQRTKAVVESNHNVLFIAALWAPVLCVYIYDVQIWFTLYQSIVGMFMGIASKMGHYTTFDHVKYALRGAPDLFDATVASLRAREQRTSPRAGAPDSSREESVRLRFAIVWNEVISSFRLNDLLDDRETVILQYRIVDNGRKVQEPLLLLAGQTAGAIDIATKAAAKKWTTDSLLKRLHSADVTEGTKDSLDLTRDVFRMLLGKGEEDGALSVIDFVYNSSDIASLVDFSHLPALADNMVDLLSAILDMPEDLSALEDMGPKSHDARMAFDEQTRLVIKSVREIFHTFSLMVNDRAVSARLENCAFLDESTDLSFQKEQLLALYRAEADADAAMVSDMSFANDSFVSTSKFAREDFVSSCTRLFFLLRLDVANSQPRCDDAKRRLQFFLHSLTMDMPRVASVEAMPSFSVMTPYYGETVLFTLDELKDPVSSNPLFEKIDVRTKEKGRSDLTIMRYLITFHAEEWSNFLERIGVSSVDEALEQFPMQVRLWASLRGQTLARTVYGMMMYEDALRLLRWLELWNHDMDETGKVNEMNRISALKFSYITSCQIYSQQVEKGDHRASDIDYLMRRFPSWRVSFVDAIKEYNGEGEVTRYDCVLVKAEGEEIVDVYRYEMPGNPILGEGKPENQNVALPFTRGEYLQTIDMNQEHYFEETLKMPNFLATASAIGSEDVTIIGMKEHVFTGRASSLARFMTLQELVFVTLTQRVLAKPLRSRMHYGHPDVFEKSFVMTNGGVAKASKGVNLSEDVFSGYNVTLRGGLVTHVEFMQCGKGRDVTLSQINAFEAKLSNGSAESCLSREGHRMANHLDFFRLSSMYYGHFGFYICNALTVLCVYIFAYSKLYVATHNDVIESAAANTKELDSLATVMSTQYILQFGLLATIPLFSTLIVEFGWRQAALQIFELVSALGIVFYIFLTGTKAHYFDVALIRGGSKYRGTGRGFSITRDPMVDFFKEYGISHFRKAVELIGVMILYGIYGNFEVGVGVLDAYCETAAFDCEKRPDLIPGNITTLDAFAATPQNYGVASFAVLLLGSCWLMAPFIFNTDGLVLQKTKVDVVYWFAWMMRVKSDGEFIDEPERSPSGGSPGEGWIDWWSGDVNLMTSVGPMTRLTYALREIRHPLAMYFVFITQFENAELYILVTAFVTTWVALSLGNLLAHHACGRHQTQLALSARGMLYVVFVLGGITFGPLIVGKFLGWSSLKGLTLSISVILGMNAICQYAIALHGCFGLSIATWSPIVSLGFVYDMIVGVFLVVPLLALSALPFMRILQTRMMFNGGFARSLSSASEVAASICIMLGLLGGYIFGFMSCFVLSLGFVNDPKYHFINRSFFFFINEVLDSSSGVNLATWTQDGYLKSVCALSSVVAVLGSLILGKFMGRRATMGLAGVFIAVGLGVNFIDSGSAIVMASSLIAIGSALLGVTYLLYSFEICTKGWRGKGGSMFLLGTTLGFMIHAIVHYNVNEATISDDWTNKPADNWRLVPLYAVLPAILLLWVVLWFIPESPIWYLYRKDIAKGTEILIRLRRRQNVEWEVAVVQSELNEPNGQRNLVYRVFMAFMLQTLLAMLMSNCLVVRELIREDNSDSDPGDVGTSSWLVYFGICTSTGVAFSVFLIDNVRRKTILKDFLPFMALLSIVCAVLDTVVDGQQEVITALVLVIFVTAGLGVMGATWLSSLEMFGAGNRALFFSLSVAAFYAIQGVLFYFMPSFALCHFVFGGICAALTVVIFAIGASTKQGAIQLKSEKKRQRQQRAASGPEEEPRPSSMQAVAERQAHQQQARIAQVGQPHQAYARNHMTGLTINQATMLEPTRPQLVTEASNHSYDSTLSNETTATGPLQLAVLNRRNNSSVINSFEFNSTDEGDDFLADLMLDDLSTSVVQPRSVSFLQSRTFPDAQMYAEMGGRRGREVQL